jgi:hypothetical protein
MNALDIKIDSMVQQFSTTYSDINYRELRNSADELLKVMSRAHVIKFLKYAESLKAGA